MRRTDKSDRSSNINSLFALIAKKQALKGLLFLLFIPLAWSASAEGESQPDTAAEDEQVVQDNSPSFWLQRMASVMTTGNYEMALVHGHAGQLEPIQLLHGTEQGQQLTYISYLNGPLREKVQRGDMVSYFEYETQPYSLRNVPLRGPIPNVLLSGMEHLSNHYQFVLAGRGRNAGRVARVVRIVPADEFRYGALIWIDEQSGFLLRAEVLNPAGEVVEQLQTVSFMLTDEAPPLLRQLAMANLPPVLEPVSDPQANELVNWASGWLPEGFALQHKDRHRLALTNEVVDYLLYSDGWTEISVYIAPAEGVQGNMLVEQGATNLFTVLKNGVEITAVGQAPQATIEKVAQSVYPLINTGQRGGNR